ncbi:hypothetical protein AAC387_Pa08g1535 [Persea americana]
MSILEKNIIEITYKLEKIFPPSFFDSMEHLQIHLPYEACVGGLVQNRWMYPFERVMGNLKRKVKNRSYVEGSICEAYSFDEISMFVSDYFLDEVLIKANRVPRHDDGGNVELHGRLSAFGLPGRAYGKGKRIFLSEEELHAAHTYILFNCEEIDDFVRSYDDKLKANQSGITDKDIQLSRDLNFALWLKDKALNDVSIPSNVQVQAMGPDRDQVRRNGYKVNGYDFHTKTYAVRKRQLTLECVFKEIVTMSLVVPFTGSWRKSMSCRTRVLMGVRLICSSVVGLIQKKGIRVDQHGIADIDVHRSTYVNAPFVLPTQTLQVYYTPSHVRKRDRPPADWQVVIHTPTRTRVQLVDGEFYQEEMLHRPPVINVDDNNELNQLVSGDEPDELDPKSYLCQLTVTLRKKNY